MPPNASSAFRASAATASASVTSVGATMSLPPTRSQSRATSSRTAPRRAARTTRKPRRAKARAVARPMPLEAPVTTTEAPRRSRMVIPFFSASGSIDRLEPAAHLQQRTGHERRIGGQEHVSGGDLLGLPGALHHRERAEVLDRLLVRGRNRWRPERSGQNGIHADALVGQLKSKRLSLKNSWGLAGVAQAAELA